jgi:hypothetical protein
MKFKNESFHSCRELYGTLSGKEVWIAGFDPSLAGYPDDFFDGKKSITLHLAHIKFPQADFRYSSEYDRSSYLLEKDPEYRNGPLIAAWAMYGKSKKETEDLLENNREVYFHRMMSYPPFGIRGKIDESYTRFKIAQTMRNHAHIWGGHGSCLHTCIYMAILSGASTIHLIGCGHNLYSEAGLEHFSAVEDDHHKMRPGYRSFSDPVENAALIEQTGMFRKLCREKGINFLWHRKYTPAMDDMIEYPDEWLAAQKKKAERSFPLIKRLYWIFIKKPLYSIVTRL